MGILRASFFCSNGEKGIYDHDLISKNQILICRELYRNNLNGEIPKELGNLKNLISLDLYANKLTGTIPKSLSKLGSLRFMYVPSPPDYITALA